MLRFFFLIAFNLIALSLLAQSVLWEVTGRRLSEPSYLLGTIHIQDARVFAFGDEVWDAFNKSEAFAMELLLDEIDPDVMRDGMFMTDNSLDNLLSEEDYKMLDSIVRAKIGQGLMLFNKMKPFFLSSQLMQLDLAKDFKDPLDLHLLNLAREQDKIILGIEDFSDQITAIDAISLEEQIQMLIDGLTDTVETPGTQIEVLIDAYITGDLEKMYKLTTDTTLPAAFHQAFLVDRNIKMARRIHRFMRRHSTFSAIGAAHLPGEKGVIQLLRDRGYTVEPILFEWQEVQLEEKED